MMNLDTNLVLVTGPLGWLGSRVVATLASSQPGLRIRCLVQPGQTFLPLAELSENLRICVGDLRRPADLARFCEDAKGAVLLHLAGAMRPRWTWDFSKVNRDGTAALLGAAVKSGVRRVVAVSHSAACGWGGSVEAPLTEDSPRNPREAFGRSMLAMEQSVTAKQSEMETVILRAPQFYGPNPPPAEACRFRRLLAGEKVFAGPGTNPRSMAFVDNVAQAVLLAAATPKASGQLYWIADRVTPTAGEVESTLDKLLKDDFVRSILQNHTGGVESKLDNLLQSDFGKPATKRKVLSGGVFSAASALTTALQSAGLAVPALARFAETPATLAVSIAKAEAELGYKPAVALEEGLRQTLRWCLEHPAVKPAPAPAPAAAEPAA